MCHGQPPSCRSITYTPWLRRQTASRAPRCKGTRQGRKQPLPGNVGWVPTTLFLVRSASMGFLSAVVSPSGAACALAVLGLTARFWRRRPGFSWGLLASSASIALVFSSGMVATALMSPLEYAYPTLRNASAYPQVDRIVVLTAW